MRACFKTDKGKVRSANQDCLLLSDNLFGVADGMGGHQGGEVASRITTQVVKNHLKGRLPQPELLQEAVEAANTRVFEMQGNDRSLRGMGTTLSVLWCNLKFAYIAQVGDSRVYLLRKDELKQITHDHSYVQELVDAGVITSEQARTHPQRNLITRAIGTERTVQVDIFTADIYPQDRFLICSDGLYGLLLDERINAIIHEAKTDEEAVNRLLKAALDAGGTDNVSLILCGAEVSGV